MNRQALAIIDTQRGFMPATEGERLGLEGFGELGVDGGPAVVGPLNQLTHTFRNNMLPIVYTQDWHPEDTKHFDAEPNFVNTWPAHCRADTPGAELHPDLLIAQHPSIAERFVKGDVAATSPEDDTSYTGVLAHDPETGLLLPDALRKHKVAKVYLGGLALGDGGEYKLCVDSTAFDLKAEGFDVTVITDAVEAVLPENRAKSLQAMAAYGINLVTTAQAIAEVEAAYAG